MAPIDMNLIQGSNNTIMHFDLYITYTDRLTRSIVTHEDVTTRLLLTCHKPMFVWTHDKNNLNLVPIVQNVVVVVVVHQIAFELGVTLNKSNNKKILCFLWIVSLSMT